MTSRLVGRLPSSSLELKGRSRQVNAFFREKFHNSILGELLEFWLAPAPSGSSLSPPPPPSPPLVHKYTRRLVAGPISTVAPFQLATETQHWKSLGPLVDGMDDDDDDGFESSDVPVCTALCLCFCLCLS